MKKQKNTPLLTAAVVCAISLAVMITALFTGSRQGRGEFSPPPFDLAVRAGIPTVPAELGWSELDAQVFQASVCGVVIPKGNKADIWLTSPAGNTVWLKLRVLDKEGNILGETGLLRPGEYIQSVTLNTIPEAGAPIALKLMAYQPETYYSEGAVTLNTTIRESGQNK